MEIVSTELNFNNTLLCLTNKNLRWFACLESFLVSEWLAKSIFIVCLCFSFNVWPLSLCLSVSSASIFAISNMAIGFSCMLLKSVQKISFLELPFLYDKRTIHRVLCVFNFIWFDFVVPEMCTRFSILEFFLYAAALLSISFSFRALLMRWYSTFM